MPFEVFLCRVSIRRVRQHFQLLTVQRIIMAPILKLLADTATNFDSVVQANRQISEIKEVVQVRPQEDSIV